jgi:hypothetical protein
MLLNSNGHLISLLFLAQKIHPQFERPCGFGDVLSTEFDVVLVGFIDVLKRLVGEKPHVGWPSAF